MAELCVIGGSMEKGLTINGRVTIAIDIVLQVVVQYQLYAP